MFSLGSVLPSSSLAAEAVLRSGIDIVNTELPQTAKTELLLLTEDAVGSWGLISYSENVETGSNNLVPKEWQWELIKKGSVSLPRLEIERLDLVTWLLQASDQSCFVPISWKPGCRKNYIQLSLNSVIEKKLDARPLEKAWRNKEDELRTLVWVEGSTLIIREQLSSEEFPAEDFHWEMRLHFMAVANSEVSLNLSVRTQLGSLPQYTYQGLYKKL